jgi:hypothetical protein
MQLLVKVKEISIVKYKIGQAQVNIIQKKEKMLGV